MLNLGCRPFARGIAYLVQIRVFVIETLLGLPIEITMRKRKRNEFWSYW